MYAWLYKPVSLSLCLKLKHHKKNLFFWQQKPAFTNANSHLFSLVSFHLKHVLAEKVVPTLNPDDFDDPLIYL